MKKTIILMIFLCAAFGLAAQSRNTGFNNLSVTTSGETVTVAFTAEIGRKAAAAGTTVIYAPVITDGRHRVSLPAIIVQGRRASTAWQRHEWASGKEVVYENGTYTKNGGRVEYRAQVDFQHWMYDSAVAMETVTAGCCNSNACLSILAADILPAPAPIPVLQPQPELVAVEREPSVIEFLQSAFSFVLPASEFDEREPFRFFDDERDNALTIYYRLNKYDIDPNYADNGQTLMNLVSAINMIRRSGEGDVRNVVVAGFASPEGPLEVNDRLAWERAVSVKEYILNNTDMPDNAITLFNGSADWHGLRQLVAADPNVPSRRRVLDIIDNHPIWDVRTQSGRQTMLRNLDGGAPYRYMSQYLFPKLRNGAFIRVYFETPADQ